MGIKVKYFKKKLLSSHFSDMIVCLKKVITSLIWINATPRGVFVVFEIHTYLYIFAC